MVGVIGRPILHAALACADAGIRVLPLAGKRPLFTTGSGHAAASTDPDQIRRWWQHWPEPNAGAVNGPVSGIFTVDVDVKTGAPGARTLRAIERRHGRLPRTWTQITPSGGYHYLYRWPPGVDRLRGGLGPGVDVKAAGGITVLAPSRSADPVRYPHRYGTHRPLSELADAPVWLIEMMATEATKPRPPSVPALPAGEATEAGRRRLAGITDRLARAEHGERHDLLLWAAARAGEVVAGGGVAEDVAMGELEAAVATWKLPQTPTEQARVDAAIRDGFEYGRAAR